MSYYRIIIAASGTTGVVSSSSMQMLRTCLCGLWGQTFPELFVHTKAIIGDSFFLCSRHGAVVSPGDFGAFRLPSVQGAIMRQVSLGHVRYLDLLLTDKWVLLESFSSAPAYMGLLCCTEPRGLFLEALVGVVREDFGTLLELRPATP